MAENLPRSALDQLPVELVQAILITIPDLPSIQSAILSCPHFYRVFQNDKRNILKQLTKRHLNPRLLDEAAVTRKSSHLQQAWSTDKAYLILERLFHDRQVTELEGSLSEIIPLAEMYDHIYFFARDLASKALANAPGSPHPGQQLSDSELYRIELNLYKFELYCNLFRDVSWLGRWRCVEEDWFWQFSPWENEQIACVHDYLVSLIEPILREQAENDDEWLKYFHSLEADDESGPIQHQLSMGLARIRSLVEANDYAARRKLLHGAENRQIKDDFLEYQLGNAATGDGRLLSDIPEEEIHYFGGQWVRDDDEGPEIAWRWAHDGVGADEWVFGDGQIPLREWAYVMWDRERLDSWGVCEYPWGGLGVERV